MYVLCIYIYIYNLINGKERPQFYVCRTDARICDAVARMDLYVCVEYNTVVTCTYVLARSTVHICKICELTCRV